MVFYCTQMQLSLPLNTNKSLACATSSLQNIKLDASEVLKPYGKYTIGILQESDTEPPTVLPLMIGAAAVALKKK